MIQPRPEREHPIPEQSARPAWESDRLQAARQLALRLERLSADSHWARQASGLRGALLRCLEGLESGAAPDPHLAARLEELLQRGQFILVKAARAIRTPDTQFD